MNIKKRVTGLLVFTTMFSMLNISYNQDTNKVNILKPDAVSAATGVSASPNQVSNTKYYYSPIIKDYIYLGKSDEITDGVKISEADKNREYGKNILVDKTFHDDTGYLTIQISKEVLNGNFVNVFKHIGINDEKYDYKTVNKDTRQWDVIYIPYKYLKKGENDIYLYTDSEVYKDKVVTPENFGELKDIPEFKITELVEGKDSSVKIRVDGERASEWISGLKDSNIKLNNAKWSYKEVPADKLNISIDENNREIEITFKDDIYSYDVFVLNINKDGFLPYFVSLTPVVKAPKLVGEWNENGNKAFKVKEESGKLETWLRDIDNIILIERDSKTKKVLEKGKDFTANYYELEILSHNFTSDTDYSIVLHKSATSAVELETKSLGELTVNEAPSIKVENVKFGKDVIVNYTPENSDWVSNISEIILTTPRGYNNSVVDVNGVKKDGALQIPFNQFSDRDNSFGKSKITVKSKGYSDVSTEFNRIKDIDVSVEVLSDKVLLKLDDKDVYENKLNHYSTEYYVGSEKLWGVYDSSKKVVTIDKEKLKDTVNEIKIIEKAGERSTVSFEYKTTLDNSGSEVLEELEVLNTVINLGEKLEVVKSSKKLPDNLKVLVDGKEIRKTLDSANKVGYFISEDNRITIMGDEFSKAGNYVVSINGNGLKDAEVKVSVNENKVEANTVDIIFNSNGGSEISNLKINKGSKISKPNDPVKKGFIFSAWYTDNEFVNRFDFSKEVEENLTLYAKWEEDSKNSFNYGLYEIAFGNNNETETKNTTVENIKSVSDSLVKYILKFGDVNYTKSSSSNDTQHQLEVAPFIKDDRTMLPMRFVAESLGFKIEWDDATRMATFKKDNTVVEISLDSKTFTVDGIENELDTLPEVVKDRMVLPVSSIARALKMSEGIVGKDSDKDIMWDGTNRTVTITVK